MALSARYFQIKATPTTGGILEAHSSAAVSALANSAGVDAGTIDPEAAVILATDPALAASNAARAAAGRPAGPGAHTHTVAQGGMHVCTPPPAC